MNDPTEREQHPNSRRVELGRLAVMAADPDFKENNDSYTSLVDTLANVRHWSKSAGLNWIRAMAEADAHYQTEIREVEIGDVPPPEGPGEYRP